MYYYAATAALTAQVTEQVHQRRNLNGAFAAAPRLSLSASPAALAALAACLAAPAACLAARFAGAGPVLRDQLSGRCDVLALSGFDTSAPPRVAHAQQRAQVGAPRPAAFGPALLHRSGVPRHAAREANRGRAGFARAVGRAVVQQPDLDPVGAQPLLRQPIVKRVQWVVVLGLVLEVGALPVVAAAARLARFAKPED